ncbi:DivIVA domain-containing protein [Spiroplasma sp. AdecLV25b]|uniref:DivIVA domain-containing protein n=1 Tax=Spiroplasma sp. AdecLV25b TaxID=3027162 RepID=UPI0027E1F45A|nr:DivIVA domain-containing protein [Spiroplasma sp. AdecLV25b]
MNINKKDIINKEFSVDYKGYNAQEVDLFLDLVATNFELLEEYVTKLKKQNEILETDNNKILLENDSLKTQLVILKQQKQKLEAKGVENIDIITRLSKLESIVHEE